jgi:hypothetical protein
MVPDEILMMLPLRCSRITRETAREHSQTPRTFTAITRSHSATAISSNDFRGWTSWAKIAALLISTSIRPNSPRACDTMAATLASSATSTWQAVADSEPSESASA